ncbi:gamma carbonic anhydrase family protein [Clostridium sp. PL3]|uniref:Gamma carbonic anhydrase family protein n=1 Tax=Clostridium thailandense TaxID=2794346 RepID=A0A949WX41_9CLOT|nr:gamma carbonic anhydrase family protein [Clostridium thailandense]MBV7275527.1 gamma carbonic anhydrase family protein [Clostridium thailandense]
MIRKFKDRAPKIHESCFIADTAEVIGKVTLEEKVSIWFGAVLRGDENAIYIGKGSNIQDNCTVHGSTNGEPTEVGDYVTIGHNVVLHGCKIGNGSLIGMGSIILDGAQIGEGSLIGAGSLVPPNKKMPDGVLCMGSPAKVIRELSEEEKEYIKYAAEHYIEEIEAYK